jgi:alkylation response protein AidB-like acyl-CoA dehydrogenase
VQQNLLDPAILQRLAAAAEEADRHADWPADSWNLVLESGALAWGIPAQYGGRELDPVAQLIGHETLATACLTTAFILSPREAALRRILSSQASHLKDRYLPALAEGEQFLTVGLSQLTTSRQHRAPALAAQPMGNGQFRLDGETPWVTAADKADAIVGGATLPDSRQLLFVLPLELPGVSVGSPLELMALSGSRTSLVKCNAVELGPDWLLAGPVQQVLGPVGGGGLDTSCLGLGLAGAAIDHLHREAQNRPELKPIAERFENVRQAVRRRLHELAVTPPDAKQTLTLRVDSTRLALRATQTALTVSKGAGFVAPHPAQRWARQALFFLVWSCPRPAAEGILSELVPREWAFA